MEQTDILKRIEELERTALTRTASGVKRMLILIRWMSCACRSKSAKR